MYRCSRAVVSTGRLIASRHWLWLLALLLTACASNQLAPLTERTSGPGWRPTDYQIQPGDTLYSIAWEFGFDYRQLARWNHIQPPYKIITATRLRLSAPAKDRTKIVKKIQSKTGLLANRPKLAQPTKPRTTRSQPTRKLPPATEKIIWKWPTKGVVDETYSAKLGHNRGLNITGRSGQPISAAAAGTVVYAGSGLKAYGKMVIIKHSEKFLSAYAHNQTMSVTEGQWVKTGQKIAQMGRNSAGKTILHFEIRSNGKPTDPAKLLPKPS